MKPRGKGNFKQRRRRMTAREGLLCSIERTRHADARRTAARQTHNAHALPSCCCRQTPPPPATAPEGGKRRTRESGTLPSSPWSRGPGLPPSRSPQDGARRGDPLKMETATQGCKGLFTPPARLSHSLTAAGVDGVFASLPG